MWGDHGCMAPEHRQANISVLYSYEAKNEECVSFLADRHPQLSKLILLDTTR